MTRRLSILAIGLVLTEVAGCCDSGNGGSGDSSNNGSDTSEVTAKAAAFDQQIELFKERTQANPADPTAWLGLIQQNLNVAQSEVGIDPKTGAMTERGKQAATESLDAWQRYLKLTKQPSAATAERVAAINGALEDPTAALAAQRIAAKQRPDQPSVWAKVALFAYAAGDDRLGDKAQAKAIGLTDTDKRESMRAQLRQEKKQAKEFYESSEPAKAKTETTP